MRVELSLINVLFYLVQLSPNSALKGRVKWAAIGISVKAAGC